MTSSQPKSIGVKVQGPVSVRPELAVEFAQWTNTHINEDPRGALVFADLALFESGGLPEPFLEAEALRIRGMAAFQLDRMAQAHADATRSAELSEEIGDTQGRLKSRNLMATSALMMGDSARAESILREGLPDVRAHGDEQLISLYLGNLAGIALNDARVFEAIELLLEAQGLAERNGWIDEWLGIANNLATCYIGLRDAHSAARMCRQALTRFDQHSDMRANRPYLLHSLGCAMEQMGELEQAISCHQKAADSAVESVDIGIASSALLDAGRVSRKLGSAKRARGFYQSLLDLRRDDDDDSTEFHALAVWGLEAIDGTFTRHTADRLRRLIDRGVPPDRDQRRHVYDALAESLVGLQDLEGAVAVLQESLAYRDALWEKTLQLHAYSSAQAIQIQEARRQADEERWQREELVTTFAQVERLNRENEVLVLQLREQAILLEQLSREDSLTGLLNRRAFDERHAEIVATASECDIQVCTSFLDIDDFKGINDQFSHGVGDEVLRTIARLISETVRDTDPVGRYGGEEFVLAMPGVDAAEARGYGERIHEAVNAYPWEQIAPGLTVTLCIGMWSGSGDTAPADALARADKLLYEAKRAGKNQLRVSEG